jgi:flagellar basal-body rod protein FlgC
MDFGAIETSAAGMRAQRLRMETAALNLANAETTSFSTEERDGRVVHVPYRRRSVEFTVGADGRPLGRVVEDASPFRAEHEPGHPHATSDGTLLKPNVHPLTEMTELMAASRAYEANVAALDTAKAMQAAALRILA